MPVFLIPGRTGQHDTRATISNQRSGWHDTCAAISSQRRVLHDTLFVVPIGVFMHAGGSVFFSTRPQRPSRVKLQRFQQSGRTSDGDLYIYNKSSLRRYRHRLSFAKLPGTTAADLLLFFDQVVKGARHKFSWTDHTGTVRSVSFAEPRLRRQPVGHDRFQVDFELEEDL